MAFFSQKGAPSSQLTSPLLGQDEVAVVNRVEGAAEDAEVRHDHQNPTGFRDRGPTVRGRRGQAWQHARLSLSSARARCPGLRLPPELMDELNRWAKDELRSLNAQIEYVLCDALRRPRKQLDRDGDPDTK